MTELRRNLRLIYSDAIAFSVMVGAGETYLAAFALALGMGELVAGLIASLPMLAGAILQLVSPAAVRRLGSHRRWVVVCALAQACSFIPLVAAAVWGKIEVWAIFAIAALYWGAGLATGPAWNTWVSTLVPGRLRAHYFAKRSRVAHMAVLAGLIVGGVGLQWGESHGKALVAFAMLFGLAGLCRFISSALLANQSEPQPPDQKHREVPWTELVSRVQHYPDGRLLIYMIATTAAVFISGPYFTPYMLGELKMTYANYLLLIATSYSSRILILPVVASVIRRTGVRRVLWFAGLGMVPLSALWLVSDSLLYLFFVQLTAGAVWAAYELATFLMLFETIREEERTSVLTSYNLAHAAATVTGATVGGAILTGLGTGPDAYMAVFAISGVVRVFTIALLARAAKSMPTTELAEPIAMPTRVVAVRPNLGAIERPILPGLPAAAAPPPAPPAPPALAPLPPSSAPSHEPVPTAATLADRAAVESEVKPASASGVWQVRR